MGNEGNRVASGLNDALQGTLDTAGGLLDTAGGFMISVVRLTARGWGQGLRALGDEIEGLGRDPEEADS